MLLFLFVEPLIHLVLSYIEASKDKDMLDIKEIHSTTRNKIHLSRKASEKKPIMMMFYLILLSCRICGKIVWWIIGKLLYFKLLKFVLCLFHNWAPAENLFYIRYYYIILLYFTSIATIHLLIQSTLNIYILIG